MGRVEVSGVVRGVALAQGAAGERWLASLDELVAAAGSLWGLVLGEPILGGTASWVCAVTLRDGSPAVLKVALPLGQHGELEHEVRVLELADGRGCVRLLGHDLDLGAVLLERLGGRLHDLGLPPRDQIAAICGALERLWSVSVGDAAFPTLAEKVPWFAEFTTTTWEALDRPCPEAVVDRSLTYLERRMTALDPARYVLAHGDAHPWNTLVDLTGGYRLVDPDGLLAEPEYDLAIVMRELTDELVAGDALALGQERARQLAARTGYDRQRIWEWGYIERLSTGLLCLKDGMEDEGRSFLQVAEAWSRARP